MRVRSERVVYRARQDLRFVFAERAADAKACAEYRVRGQARFVAEQIVNFLARTEARSGNSARAISWLELLKKLSPHPDEIDKRIAEVHAGKSLEAE